MLSNSAKQRKYGGSTLDEGIRTEERSQSVSLKTTDEYLKERRWKLWKTIVGKGLRTLRSRWKGTDEGTGRDGAPTGWLGIFWGLDGFITGRYD